MLYPHFHAARANSESSCSSTARTRPCESCLRCQEQENMELSVQYCLHLTDRHYHPAGLFQSAITTTSRGSRITKGACARLWAGLGTFPERWESDSARVKQPGSL